MEWTNVLWGYDQHGWGVQLQNVKEGALNQFQENLQLDPWETIKPINEDNRESELEASRYFSISFCFSLVVVSVSMKYSLTLELYFHSLFMVTCSQAPKHPSLAHSWRQTFKRFLQNRGYLDTGWAWPKWSEIVRNRRSPGRSVPWAAHADANPYIRLTIQGRIVCIYMVVFWKVIFPI